MSDFEDFPNELANVQHELIHYAAICGVDLQNPQEVESCLNDHKARGTRETLRGLLILRLKVETAMLEDGQALPQYVPHSPT